MPVFYGWWIVVACMLAALFGNALGLFGAGVYLHEVVQANGWTTGLVSGVVTLFYVVSALLLIPVGSGIVQGKSPAEGQYRFPVSDPVAPVLMGKLSSSAEVIAPGCPFK
jgi:hypothetical protein